MNSFPPKLLIFDFKTKCRQFATLYTVAKYIICKMSLRPHRGGFPVVSFFPTSATHTYIHTTTHQYILHLHNWQKILQGRISNCWVWVEHNNDNHVGSGKMSSSWDDKSKKFYCVYSDFFLTKGRTSVILTHLLFVKYFVIRNWVIKYFKHFSN